MRACSTLDSVARLMPLASANSSWLHANASLCSLILIAKASARTAVSGARGPDLPFLPSRARPKPPSANPRSPSTAPRMPMPFLSALLRLRLPNFTTLIPACSLLFSDAATLVCGVCVNYTPIISQVPEYFLSIDCLKYVDIQSSTCRIGRVWQRRFTEEVRELEAGGGIGEQAG